MVRWHRTRRGDLGLRAMALALLTVSYLAISHLIAIAPLPPEKAGGAASLALAAIGFLCASAGSAMAILGHHLFDEVAVSARWGTDRRSAPRVLRPKTPGGDDDVDGTGWGGARAREAA